MSMKRILSYLALPLLLCTACGKERPAPQAAGQEPAMKFGVEALGGRASFEKADSITSLGLFGYSTGTQVFDSLNPLHLPNLFYNREVSRTISKDGNDATIIGDWTYAPMVFWPSDVNVKNTFFAYAPHTSRFPAEAEASVSAQTAWDYPTLWYTVPDRVSDQMDVLYAKPVKNVTKAYNGGQVLYEMNHALSWLIFVVVPTQRPAIPGTDQFQITSLRFVVSNLVTRSELNLGTGAWRDLETSPADYEFDVLDTPIPAGQVSVITPPASRLMLIPQPLTQARNPSSIDVTFKVSNIADGDAGDDDEYFYSIPFPDTKLHAGQVTIYLLRLSVEGIEVEFHEKNTIDQWLKGEGQTLEIY